MLVTSLLSPTPDEQLSKVAAAVDTSSILSLASIETASFLEFPSHAHVREGLSVECHM